MQAIRKILVPTDFTEQSDRAFDMACCLARDAGAQMIVVHVVPLPAVIYGPPPESYLEHLREKLELIQVRDPRISVQYHLVEGDTARAILQEAGEMNCDAIVMGTHGRTGLRRLILGSIAEEVVRKAPCSVVVVKMPS
jgi:nucleotide-binding universal stress UspA family protein